MQSYDLNTVAIMAAIIKHADCDLTTEIKKTGRESFLLPDVQIVAAAFALYDAVCHENDRRERSHPTL